MTDTLSDKLRQMVARSDDELDALWEAADRIEELEAALQVAEKGLATALTWSDGDGTWVAHDAVVKARNAARAALGETMK